MSKKLYFTDSNNDVYYNNLTGISAIAIKELSKKIDSLESELK